MWWRWTWKTQWRPRPRTRHGGPYAHWLRQRLSDQKKLRFASIILSSPWGLADLEAVARAKPDAIILPKVASAAEIGAAQRGIALWAMIETPGAVLGLSAIAQAGATCLILGSNDLTKDMRGRAMPGRANLWAAMCLTVLSARAHALSAIDGTYNAIADAAGLAAACQQGRDFGFDGKSLIHPSQIEAANLAFAPDAEEIAAARRSWRPSRKIRTKAFWPWTDACWKSCMPKRRRGCWRWPMRSAADASVLSGRHRGRHAQARCGTSRGGGKA